MKWTSTAGPRQTKAVETNLRKIYAEHNTRVEKWGVKGGEEHSSVLWSPFGGGQREDVAREWATLGETFRWTTTRENASLIVGAATLALETLARTRPVDDKRQTPEEAAERDAKIRQMDTVRSAQAREERSRLDAELATLKAQYPWAETTGSSWARGARNLKHLLTDRWPGIKFEVRSESYSMGCSIRVRWEDGPTAREVDTIADQFQDSDFDGMTDCSNSRGASAFRELMGHAKHVFVDRAYSCNVQRAVARGLCALQNKPWLAEWDGANYGGWQGLHHLCGENDPNDLLDHVRQVLSETSLPAGAQVAGVRHAKDEESGWAVVELEQAEGSSDDARNGTRLDLRHLPLTAVTWRLNPAKEGVEIRFRSKPETATLESLKSRGWRWSRFSKCWYHKQTPAAVEFARQIAEATEESTPQLNTDEHRLATEAPPVPTLPPIRHADLAQVLGAGSEAPRRFDPSRIPAEPVQAEPPPPEVETERLAALLLSSRSAVLPTVPHQDAPNPVPAPEPATPPVPPQVIVPVNFTQPVPVVTVPVQPPPPTLSPQSPQPAWMRRLSFVRGR